MARALVSPVSPTLSGVAPTFTAAIVDGHMFDNTGNQQVYVKNTDASPHTITVPTPGTVGTAGHAVADHTFVVPAASERLVGTFETSVYNQRSGVDMGRVYFDYDSVTGVSIMVQPA